MGRECKKCGGLIPNRVVIDGRVRVLSNRKYCLSCSPFGRHNTKQIHKSERKSEIKECASCGREFLTKKQTHCAACNYKKAWLTRREKVHGWVGTSCWRCGYDQGMAGISVLEFHHMDPKKKRFCVNRREIATLRWSRVEEEMKKCALLCCRCHREFHAELFSQQEMNRIYQEGWR